MNEPGILPSASQVLNELSEEWVEVECPSEQVLTEWGWMVSMERLGPQCQSGMDTVEPLEIECAQAKDVGEMECTAVQGLEATVTEVVAELETEKPDGVGGRNQGPTTQSERLESHRIVCASRLSCSSNLKQHKAAWKEKIPELHGQNCNGAMSSSSTKKQPVRSRAGEKQNECNMFATRFITSSRVKQHKLIHTGEKPFQCDLCEARFTYSSKLKRHKLIHTGEKPFQCDTCQRKFGQLSTLKKHKRIHTGEKPFPCDVCGARFIQSTNLKNHKLIHTGEKPFQCDKCEGKFARLSNLKAHKCYHTGEKPYQCNTCEGKFTRLATLKRHKRIHTGEKPFQCDVCETTFTQSATLKRHKLTHTRETMQVQRES